VLPSALCRECGAAVDDGGERCTACIAESSTDNGVPIAGDGEQPSGSSGSLAVIVRAIEALIYVGLCILMLYCSIPFFEDGDWWFGAMAIGLAAIAVIGVKQTLFPKEWTPE